MRQLASMDAGCRSTSISDHGGRESTHIGVPTESLILLTNHIFDESIVLIGEDGAPFFDSTRTVAFFVSGKIWVNNHIHVLRIGRHFDLTLRDPFV